MKKVLIIANQFPPMAGSGIQRTLKFVKYLPNFKYMPIVLTRAATKNMLSDYSLLSEIPDCVSVIRTKAYALEEVTGIMRYAAKFFGRRILIPDAARLWADRSVKEAAHIIKSEEVSLIYTTSAPYSDHLLGMQLKTIFPKIKWVCDFRDEWSRNPYLHDKPYNPIRMRIEKAMECKVIESCDFVIANTPLMMENFVELYPSCKEKITFIPNGFDSNDFEQVRDIYERNQKFTICYAGLLYGRRSPHTFLAAIEKLVQEKKIAVEKIAVNFIGNYKQELMDSFTSNSRIGRAIRFFPYMEHAKCLEYEAKSECVLLIEGTGQGAEAFYTGKLFEYLKIGRPILSAIPSKGVAARLIVDTNTGIVSDYDDINQIAEAILNYYCQWKNGEISYEPKEDIIKIFERKVLTEKLSEYFNNLIR